MTCRQEVSSIVVLWRSFRRYVIQVTSHAMIDSARPIFGFGRRSNNRVMFPSLPTNQVISQVDAIAHDGSWSCWTNHPMRVRVL